MQLSWEVAGVEVVLDADPGTPFSAVRADLAVVVGGSVDQAWSVHGHLLSDDAVLGRPPLLHGARLRPSVPSGLPASTAGVEVWVDAGPDAGGRFLLTPGPHVVGRRAQGGLRLHDPTLSREHLRLEVAVDGEVALTDLGSTNGSRRDLGAPPLHAPTTNVVPGPRSAAVLAGDTLLRIGPGPVDPASWRPDGEGHVLLNPYPRLTAEPAPVVATWPELPTGRDPARLPVVALLVPLALAVVLALVWSPLSLLLGLATPVMVGAQWVSDRRAHRGEQARTRRRVAAERTAISTRHETALRAEHGRRHRDSPGPATLAAETVGVGARLFARSRADADHLRLRLGLGSVAATSSRVDPARTTPADPGDEPPTSLLHDVPVSVDLPGIGVLGVAGPRAEVLATARLLLAQVAAWHRPSEVELLVLTADPARAADWRWVRWLPHAPTPPVSGADAVAVLERLLPTLETPGRPGESPPPPRRVLLLDGTAGLRARAPLAAVLERGPAVGTLAVCVDDDRSRLPAECRRVLTLGEGPGRLLGGPDPVEVRADGVDEAWAHEVAHALAPVREAGPAGADGPPVACRLLDLLELPAADADLPGALDERWARWGGRLRTPLGSTGSAEPWVLDLLADGPHVLVAGTTGSGKSVLLRAVVAGLAASVPPERLQFVLVDYKGGAAFAAAVGLPHVAGLVTDLDERLAARVLRSLRAEVRRRERELAAAGVPDVGDLPSDHPAADRLPRLVVVVDEFRVLGEEVPEFVPELVRLAAVGRSLGIHLVLATQRPAGAVSPEIRANVDLRIALRVADRADSEDVVADPRAASIDPATPGRALVRTAAGRLHGLQVAALTGPEQDRRPGPRVRRADRPVLPGGSVDDLARLVAAATVLDVRRDRPRPAAPWLPPLPAVVAGHDLAPGVDGADRSLREPFQLPFGLLDLPAEQRRAVATWDLTSGGHLLVVGAPRSGRSQVVRTLARTTARVPGAQVVVLDGGSALADLTGHRGVETVVAGTEPWRAARVLTRVQEEVDRRRADPAGPAGPLLLLVDGWEGWTRQWAEADAGTGIGAAVEALLRLLREGSGAGLRIAVTGDRGLLTSPAAASAAEVLLLRLADRSDAVLAGVAVRDVPRAAPPGRGLLIRDGEPVEVQVAHTPPAGVHGPPRGPGSVGVAALPRVLSRDDLPPADGPWVAIGVGGDAAAPVRLDTSRPVLVAGPAGSGRSTLLATLAAACPDAVRIVPGDAAHLSALLTGPGPGPLLLVDDVAGCAGTEVEELLLRALRRPAGVRLVAAGVTAELAADYRGLAAALRTARTLVLLGRDATVPADLLSRRPLLAPGPGPGVGLVLADGVWTSLRVAR